MNRALNILILTTVIFSFSSCSILEPKSDSAEEILEKSTQQRIFYAKYDNVWRAAHSVIKYTIATENQDFGTIETDYIKSVDGWIPPFKKRPDYPSSRYKLFFTFAKGKTNGKESTRVTIEKKIESFKNIIADTQTVETDGTEEEAIFYRMERELIITRAIEKSSN